MKTIRITVYSFDELPRDTQELVKALHGESVEFWLAGYEFAGSQEERLLAWLRSLGEAFTLRGRIINV